MKEGLKVVQPSFVAIITGAASGIGKAIALGFAKEGYSVFLIDNDSVALQNAINNDFSSFKVGYHCGDVCNSVDVKEGLSTCLSQFGRVDVLVANAAIMNKKPFLELAEEEWDRAIGINLKGVFLWGQAVASWMVQSKRVGKIINISCMRAELAASNIAPYVSSKGGVTALTRAMAVELAPYGINVNAIAPGRTLTEGATPFYKDPERRKRLENLIPVGRLGVPEEIANMALFLASDKANFIVGAVIPVDGGYTSSKE